GWRADRSLSGFKLEKTINGDRKMALKGTLADMAVIDLIQFPHGGRKTGHLIISGTDGEAGLFYKDGALVHATLGDFSGMDALLRVVGWDEGTFEFARDVESAVTSINLDLHRAVMQALKLHDEFKMEEEKRRAQRGSSESGGDEALTAQLTEFLDANGFALHASVHDSEGEVRAAADGPDGSPVGIEELRLALHSLLQCHPRGPVNRILIDDDLGTVVLVPLADGDNLVVVASKDASMGAVSMSVGRLAAGLA
ncbi:MAG: DUF4388 domain-containing protein, partial [Deltaproteobacteria bacterium]